MRAFTSGPTTRCALAIAVTAGCVVFGSVALAVPRAAQRTAGAAPSAAEPRDWPAVRSRGMELLMASRPADAIGLFEPVVATHPQFWEGHAMLGAACESLGMELMAQDPGGQRSRYLPLFERAVTHLRRAFELHGTAADVMELRVVVDMYGPLRLNRPDELERGIRELQTRFPDATDGYWYAIQARAERGQPLADAVAAAGAAFTGKADELADLAFALAVNATRRSAQPDAMLDAARQFAKQAGALAPDSPPVLRAEARILRAQAALGPPAAAADLEKRAAALEERATDISVAERMRRRRP